MSVDLADYVESLKREVTPLGSTMFDAIDEAAWTGYLADAFWEARLDGFMTGFVADDEGVVTNEAGTTELDRRYIALVVLYAGIRVLRNRILNMNTGFRAKAGPVEFEQQNSATMLAEMLKQLRATKDRILDDLESTEETQTLVLDALSTRLFTPGSYYGGPELAG